jgi:hypothetical protein
MSPRGFHAPRQGDKRNSRLKPGQFSFSQQDLVLPVNGIPLIVGCTYNVNSYAPTTAPDVP